MKKFIKAGVLLLLCAFLMTMPALADSYDSQEQYGVDNNYITNSYDVDVTVHENNVYSIKNTIDVNFRLARHGIYFYIPYKGEVVRKLPENSGGNKTVKTRYRAKIENIAVTGGNYDVSSDHGYKMITIGDKNKALIGYKTYTISYDYVLPDDGIAGMDDFYFNVIPSGWKSFIKKANVTVHMPKAFDSKKAVAYIGSKTALSAGSKNSGFWADPKSNTLRLKNKEISYGAGVTIRLPLPEGYFSGEYTYDGFKTAAKILPFLPIVLIAVLYLLFGRNKKVFPTVEFYPPDGITSAEVGYIVDGTIDDKDVISLILYWADKGYVALHTEEESDDFTLELRNPLPVSAGDYEKTMFDGLFEGRKTVSSDDLQNSFYKTIMKTTTQLTESIKKKKQTVFTTASKVSRAVACLILGAPIGIYTFIMGYVNVSDWMFFGVVELVLCALLGFAASHAYQGRDSSKKSSLVTRGVFIALGFAALFGGALFVGAAVFGNVILPAVLCALTLACVVLCMIMPTRTAKSYESVAKILGLKEFIKMAELDRLKLLSDEDPEYFYHVLPYAYVLGLTDEWAQRFEKLNLPQPEWYYGSGNGMFSTVLLVHMVNSNMRNVMTSRPVDTSGGGGFSGGGFGGGFSGGGFGGGGGGSW